MLKVQSKYDEMSIDSLLYLFENIEPTDKEKKEILFNAIIKKYFIDRINNVAFNLYHYVLSRRLYDIGEEKIIAKIMNIELMSDALKTLPKEHQEDFFNVLTKFVIFIEQKVAEANGEFSMEWDFTNIPSLVTLLQNISNSDIKNTVLKQKINNLSKKIEQNYKDKLKYREEQKTALMKANSKEIVQNVEIKKLKFAKSKLTKGTVESILKDINLYEEEDKKTIINLALTKWSDSIFSLPREVAYLYFKENKTFHKYVNPLQSLKILMHDLRYTNELKIIKSMGFNSFEELIEDARKFYMSLNGATEEGCNNYITTLYYEKEKESLGYGEKYSDNIIDYLNEYVLQSALEVLRNSRGKRIDEIALEKIYVKNKNLKPLDLRVCEIKGVVDDNYVIKEDKLNEENCLTTLSYILEIFSYLKRFLFEYDGNYLVKAKEIKVYNKKYEKNVIELIDILNSYKITGASLIELRKIDTPYNSELKSHIEAIIRNYFCNTKIDKIIARDLIGDLEKYKAFAHFIDTWSHQGSYHNNTDFLYECLIEIIDDFDLSKSNDRELFFNYAIYGNSINKKIRIEKGIEYEFSMYSKIIEKLKVEVPEVIDILKNYSNLAGKEEKILEFVAIYLGVKKYKK